MKEAIIFDLDGTLTDSGEGIINCAAAALERLELPIPPREQLRLFVGPPLGDSFAAVGVAPEKIPEAIALFRERYTRIGKFENFPYGGIDSLLSQLKHLNFSMYVATSKPEGMAVEIMDHFHLSPYFDRICGATWDASRSTKDQVIAYLLAQLGRVSRAVMVGDTVYDVEGAAVHGIPTVGVTWGYGREAQMREAGAVSIAHTPQELLKILSER